MYSFKIQIKKLVFFYFTIKLHCIRKGNKLHLKCVSLLIVCPRVCRQPLTVIEGGRYKYLFIYTKKCKNYDF
jgi:hypothetical protein